MYQVWHVHNLLDGNICLSMYAYISQKEVNFVQCKKGGKAKKRRKYLHGNVPTFKGHSRFCWMGCYVMLCYVKHFSNHYICFCNLSFGVNEENKWNYARKCKKQIFENVWCLKDVQCSLHWSHLRFFILNRAPWYCLLLNMRSDAKGKKRVLSKLWLRYEFWEIVHQCHLSAINIHSWPLFYFGGCIFQNGSAFYFEKLCGVGRPWVG